MLTPKEITGEGASGTLADESNPFGEFSSVTRQVEEWQ
jgi:hypothetical protein